MDWWWLGDGLGVVWWWLGGDLVVWRGGGVAGAHPSDFHGVELCFVQFRSSSAIAVSRVECLFSGPWWC